MKPIILVIMGAAILIPIMHRHNIHYSKQLHRSRANKLQQIELKKDSETNAHGADFRIDYLP